MAQSKYALEGEQEFARLEKQSQASGYNIASELEHIEESKNYTNIVDIGAGSGVVIDELAKKFPDSNILGIEFSDIRYQQLLEKYAADHNIEILQHDILNPLEGLAERFHLATTRFVIQHIQSPQQALKNISRALVKGGMLTVIEADGILANLYCSDQKLLSMIDKVSREFEQTDLYMGRKIPSLLGLAGFHRVSWSMECVYFTSKNIRSEVEQWNQRLNAARPQIVKILGPEDTEEFIERYLHALTEVGSCLFFNKIIATGIV